MIGASTTSYGYNEVGNVPQHQPAGLRLAAPWRSSIRVRFRHQRHRRGDIELQARQYKPIPDNWAIDAQGEPTTDAKAALKGARRTFGGHKGSALAAMIELLAGSLSGDLTSAQSQAFDESTGATPCHGELLIAFDSKVFLGDSLDIGRQSAELLFESITERGARLPSQRRFEARTRSVANGVKIPSALLEEVKQLLREELVRGR